MREMDIKKLVQRHNPVIRKTDRYAPLSVGNGEFALTVDVTGLQTFAEYYGEMDGPSGFMDYRYKGIPLGTQAQWGWHTAINPQGYAVDKYPLTWIETHGRQIGYLVGDCEKDPVASWLYGNPHKIQLGYLKLDFGMPQKSIRVEAVENIDQTLDLWSGIVHSRFSLRGQPFYVQTCCHPELDLVAVRIESDLVGQKSRLGVTVEFPSCCGDGATRASFALDARRAEFQRVFLEAANAYSVIMEASDDMEWSGKESGFLMNPRRKTGTIEFVCAFTNRRDLGRLPGVKATMEASAQYWNRFWSDGGAVDFSACTDSRASELERRVVLSQYLTAIQCAGSLPPQETGLVFNSWHGRFHLEMHWWHGVHFALWGRLPLLEKSLNFYRTTALRTAKAMARQQGYNGARWPKCVGPDAVQKPTEFEAFLVWQQPHPIYYAELCYRKYRDRETLDKYREIVFETADFMASYAGWCEAENRYILGPPIMPAQETHAFRDCFNPTFELAYWAWGLDTALQWQERLGLAPDAQWKRVRDHLAALPVKDGVYVAAESAPDTFQNPKMTSDHPSMLGALGMLPETALINRETMHRTLDKVLATWNWKSAWGWDYGMCAMAAARLGLPEMAVDFLLKTDERNTYLPNGHNFIVASLPIYLPGNGSLLAAVAMMAAGWDGAPAGEAPGFPKNGNWRLQWQGLERMA